MWDYREYFVFKNLQEAVNLQEKLAKKVITEDKFEKIEFIGGADSSYSEEKGKILGVVVVLDFKTLNIVELAYALSSEFLPYIPGFLSFREGKVIVEAFLKLKAKPQVLMIDGQGIAHPRGLGIASHIGVVLDLPTIGCAKKILVGEYKEPDLKKGSLESILYKGKKVGVALRTKDNVKSIFVSPGHRISLESAVDIVKRSTTKYRLPEPIRFAHYYTKILWLKLKEEGELF